MQEVSCFPWPRRQASQPHTLRRRQSSPSLHRPDMKELVLRRSSSERKLAKDKKVSFVQYNQRDGVQTNYKTCTNSLFRPEPISTQLEHANIMIIGPSGTSSS